MTQMLPVLLASAILWQEPGKVESADLAGSAARPQPPYSFVKEDLGGTGPKVRIRDGAGVEWRVKGGHDVKPETFITRFVTAIGYYGETTHFFAEGKIQNVRALKRASGFIKSDGSFTSAAFEKIESGAEFTGAWNWNDSAFRGTPQLNGLKVLVMLFSNWDNKDGRDRRKGSNTSILRFSDGKEVHFVNDWGQSFGEWGRYFGRSNWVCGDFRKQTPRFVTGAADGLVRFGYGGAHTDDFKNDIRVDDVRWLMQYLGRIADAQIRLGLKAAGASATEEDCFAAELRTRIEQLRKITLK